MFLKKLILPILGSVLAAGCASEQRTADRYEPMDMAAYNTTEQENALRKSTSSQQEDVYTGTRNTSVWVNANRPGASGDMAFREDIASHNTSTFDNALRQPIDGGTSREDVAAGVGAGAGAVAADNTRISATEQSEGRYISNAAASEAEAYNFVEIKFEPGSTGLTESAKNSLNQVVQQAKGAGKLDEALVMSWSDEEFPSADLKKLPKYQRDLAENRNKAVRDYVKSIQRIDVDAYNMASQPNALSKLFNTTDYRLKKSLTAAGLPTTADDPQYPSKASHSIIMIKVE